MNQTAALPCLVLALLAGCGERTSPADKAAADDRAVAQVEAIQAAKPPPRPLELQAIMFDDIQANRLYDAACAFAPGGSMGAVLLAHDKAGYVKLKGRVVRLASDPGSERLPVVGWSRYTGKEFALRLVRAGEGAMQGDAQGLRWPARLTVTDAFDQVVYAADGAVQCRA
jgi:hypothetical protein